ncbi:MAG: ATP-binding protein [Dehalococcoidia bacterium]|nr:ATP-binding protein [Dehalococcoidia bacterium]
MLEQLEAIRIIEKLRNGLPPKQGVALYSVGYDRLIDGIKEHHIDTIEGRGLFRSISGSWGAGKTHLFRLLVDLAFSNNCVVSHVELDKSSQALNKFETIVYGIIRNLSTPSNEKNGDDLGQSGFGLLLKNSLIYLKTGTHSVPEHINDEYFNVASTALMSDDRIDIDFKKMVVHYWKTLVEQEIDQGILQPTRDEVIQWLCGEGSIGFYKKKYQVMKMIKRENAKWMFQSLARFVRLSGYRGLIILFDEAEASYSVMSKSALKDAQNNLRYLIDNVSASPGMFLVYAATPDFYFDPKYGVKAYAALGQRIGTPEQKPPTALQKVWNIDEGQIQLEDWQSSARKIRDIYLAAYPDASKSLPSKADTDGFVSSLFDSYPKAAAVSFPRFMVTALVVNFDNLYEGTQTTFDELKDDVMTRLREG